MHWIYAHLIGDFIFQNDWMAQRKKHSSWVCLFHVLCYLVPFLWTPLAYWQLLVIGIEHFLQDRWQAVPYIMWVAGKRKNGFLGPPLTPWSTIVMDQIFHILWIAWIVGGPPLNLLPIL